MGAYSGVRTKTRAAIEQAFWKVYTEHGPRRVTVRGIRKWLRRFSPDSTDTF